MTSHAAIVRHRKGGCSGNLTTPMEIDVEVDEERVIESHEPMNESTESSAVYRNI